MDQFSAAAKRGSVLQTTGKPAILNPRGVDERPGARSARKRMVDVRVLSGRLKRVKSLVPPA